MNIWRKGLFPDTCCPPLMGMKRECRPITPITPITRIYPVIRSERFLLRSQQVNSPSSAFVLEESEPQRVV